jgi:hypothetical protein
MLRGRIRLDQWLGGTRVLALPVLRILAMLAWRGVGGADAHRLTGSGAALPARGALREHDLSRLLLIAGLRS